MNLKPNLWTLFFIIAMAALAYVIMNPIPNPALQKKSLSVNTDDPSFDPHAINIKLTRDVFDAARRRYVRRYINTVDTMPALKAAVGVDTLGIEGYTFAYRQFETMYEEYDSSSTPPNVYIYPIIKKGEASAPDSLDLVFLIKEKGDTAKISDTFYDFTRPCPPTCDTIPYTNN